MTKNYTIHKPQLRVEFAHSCVYCDTREPEIGGAESFCVDHYKPKKKFPKLISVYNNLLYACRKCNQYKSDYWPNLFQRLFRLIILNPRKHTCDYHIAKADLEWVGKTSQGQWNILKLKLNSVINIRIRKERKDIEKTIDFLLNDIIPKKIETLEELKKTSIDRDILQEKQSEIDSFLSQAETLKRKISGPCD